MSLFSTILYTIIYMINNICHFVFGMEKQTEELLFTHYIAVYSAYLINNPDTIYFYYHYEPYGTWYDTLKLIPNLKLVKIDIPTHIGSKEIKKTAHKADWVRMNILFNSGGIYLDIDTICVKPWQHLLNKDVVLGKEIPNGICNAIMCTKRKSDFFKLWLDKYESHFNPNGWREASIELPEKLSKNFPDLLTLKEADVFFLPNYNKTHKIFVDNNEIPKNIISLHLWETFSLKYMKNINDWSWAYENSHTMYGKMLLNLIDNYIIKNIEYESKSDEFFVMTLWSPSIPYLIEILDDVKDKFNVKILQSIKKIVNNDKLLDYILKIYEPDKRCVKSYLQGKVKFIISNSIFKNNQQLYHFKICFNNTSFNKQKICNNWIELKEYIRMKIKNRLKDYLKDVIIHVTDNFEESKIVWNICNDKNIIKQLFYEINKSEINYLVLKYEKKQFTNHYEIGGDIDILINDDEPLISFIIVFLKKNNIIFKINKASNFSYSKNDIGRTYLDIYLNNKDNFDLRLDIFSIDKWNFYGYKIHENFNHLWYLKNMIALKTMNNDGIYIPHLHHEISFRKLELFKYPNKKKHQTFLNQHLNIAPRNGMSFIEKFIIQNDGYFLRDLKVSLYNKEKMKLFLKEKIPYDKIFDIVPLSESPHIKYLETKDKNVFDNYHNIVNQDPKTSLCNKFYSIEKFEKLIKSILESNNSNYNMTIKNNLIIDGCHRASILYFYFGGDYIINK